MSAKKSRIIIDVSLDENNVPDTIYWDATDKDEEGGQQAKSMSLSLWDDLQKNTLRIDLWTKDMPVDEQKRFYIDCIGGLAQSILSATGDEYMAGEMNVLCEKFIKHVQEEQKRNQQKG
jgi:gliding motility-associated protein GldC